MYVLVLLKILASCYCTPGRGEGQSYRSTSLVLPPTWETWNESLYPGCWLPASGFSAAKLWSCRALEVKWADENWLFHSASLCFSDRKFYPVNFLLWNSFHRCCAASIFLEDWEFPIAGNIEGHDFQMRESKGLCFSPRQQHQPGCTSSLGMTSSKDKSKPGQEVWLSRLWQSGEPSQLQRDLQNLPSRHSSILHSSFPCRCFPKTSY